MIIMQVQLAIVTYYPKEEGAKRRATKGIFPIKLFYDDYDGMSQLVDGKKKEILKSYNYKDDDIDKGDVDLLILFAHEPKCTTWYSDYTLAATFGDRIRELRMARGISQDEMAEVICGKRSAKANISHWEQGRHLPPITVVKAYATYFGVTVDELLD